MGKSDPFVFAWYMNNLPNITPKRIAILGSVSEGFVRLAYPESKIDLFDIQLGNWEINRNSWNIEKDCYDLVVCTRCAYFSNNPLDFIEKCKELINKEGMIFVDWGLGDHWRFKDFKVGWLKNEEHEFALYKEHKTYVMSALWNEKWESIEEVCQFKKNIEKFGYNGSLSAILQKEIPNLLFVDDNLQASFLTLWQERPQIYYITKFFK